MSNKKFDVRLDPDAFKEYNKLDNSVIGIVNKAIDELEYRADEIGKKLNNQSSTKLAGCKEIKLRNAGIRIIFRITNEIVEVLKVVYIYTIEKRSDDFAFIVADKRNKDLKNINKEEQLKHFEASKKWDENKSKM